MTATVELLDGAAGPPLGVDARLLAAICGAAIGLGIALLLFTQVRHRVRNEAGLNPVSRPGFILVVVGAICLGIAALHPAGQVAPPDLLTALRWAAPVSIAVGIWSAWANTHISLLRERSTTARAAATAR